MVPTDDDFEARVLKILSNTTPAVAPSSIGGATSAAIPHFLDVKYAQSLEFSGVSGNPALPSTHPDNFLKGLSGVEKVDGEKGINHDKNNRFVKATIEFALRNDKNVPCNFESLANDHLVRVIRDGAGGHVLALPAVATSYVRISRQAARSLPSALDHLPSFSPFFPVDDGHPTKEATMANYRHLISRFSTTFYTSRFEDVKDNTHRTAIIMAFLDKLPPTLAKHLSDETHAGHGTANAGLYVDRDFTFDQLVRAGERIIDEHYAANDKTVLAEYNKRVQRPASGEHHKDHKDHKDNKDRHRRDNNNGKRSGDRNNSATSSSSSSSSAAPRDSAGSSAKRAPKSPCPNCGETGHTRPYCPKPCKANEEGTCKFGSDCTVGFKIEAHGKPAETPKHGGTNQFKRDETGKSKDNANKNIKFKESTT